MNILCFTQYYPPEVGATQIRMQFFARYLAGQGHKVTVVTELPNHPGGVIFPGYRGRLFSRSAEDGVNVVRLWVYTSPHKTFLRRILFYGTYMVNAIFAALFLARGRYDVIFATSPPLPVVLAAYVASRFKRCPYVMDVRDLWPAVGVVLGEIRGRRLVRAAQRLELFLYRRAVAITCVTRGFMDYVVQKGVPRQKVYFLPNGTIPEVFHPDGGEKELRRRLGWDGKFVVGYCGNHGVAQGLSAVLEAARLLQGREEVRFLLVGEGPLKSQLLETKGRYGLENLEMLPEVPVVEAACYINASDIMLVPLKKDVIFDAFIPSKMFDFMACGKPVLLTVDGEARAILEESGGGVYVAPEDPQALADALLRLKEQPEELARMGERGRSFVLARFVREVQARQLEDILAAHSRRRNR